MQEHFEECTVDSRVSGWVLRNIESLWIVIFLANFETTFYKYERYFTSCIWTCSFFGYYFKHWLWKVVFLVQIFGTIHCVKRRLPFQIKQTKSGGQRGLASTQQFLLPASFEFYPHCCGSFTGIEGDIISMWMASLILYFG